MLIDEKGNPITNHRGGSVSDIKDSNKLNEILMFLRGGVRTWCNSERGKEQFALRDLFGGGNYYWEGTPLQELYYKYRAKGIPAEEAVKRAGRDAGRLLKRVLIEEADRTYQVGDAGMALGYRRVK